MILNPTENLLYTTYLGDSLYMILRYNEFAKKFEFHYKSTDQIHKFNFPYQVGTNGDSPYHAITNSHSVSHKDIIIAASDGLWDNLYDDEIIQHINKAEVNGFLYNYNKIAFDLAKKAEINSFNREFESPFSKKAKETGLNFRGGKVDDITVIVSQLTQIKHN